MVGPEQASTCTVSQKRKNTAQVTVNVFLAFPETLLLGFQFIVSVYRVDRHTVLPVTYVNGYLWPWLQL